MRTSIPKGESREIQGGKRAPSLQPAQAARISTHSNPLLKEAVSPTADLESLQAPTVFLRRRSESPLTKRSIRDLRRQKTAAEALEGFDRDTQIVGFTKGQFSVVDLIRAALAATGPAELDISTWTAANVDVTTVCEFVSAGLLTNSRWLVDLTFQRRSPQLAQRIRQTFGKEAIRVARNHAKFALIRNDTWQVVIQTSMNLNFNPRFENFTISHDPELHGFYKKIIDEVFSRQPCQLADARPYAIQQYFAAEM